MKRYAGKGQKAKGKTKHLALQFYSAVLLLTLCSVPFALCHSAFGADKWPGVDESVVEKISREHGREACDPLINTDQGDLLLFVFLLAGAAGGFAAGYYWRVLIEGKGNEN
jgi:cobalt/nickel transport protein